tara:strand:+ start:297 stop:479 length:183 start_codon:yes stop_codon:yes gene_type:complete
VTASLSSSDDQNLLEGISNVEFLKENLHKRSDNFTPTAKDKEKTDKILYHIKTALTLSES